MEAEGRCWKFGDNIPTDQIVKADRVLESLDEMARHVLENLNPDFPVYVQKGDILVAGKHFGQSSGRAVAPKAIKATGVGAVVVEYASRLFYRNCFEIGLPLMECEGITEEVSDGDILHVNMETGMIQNKTTGKELKARPVPPFLMEMLEAGGLIAFGPRIDEYQI
ncbi:MAG: 3-isopropylmalate dehydratase [Hungatella hathewayi]|uniref:LeuD/DmdB family oxidoreductase small subunit n=1 Tax=Hungatella TaxID=1649459 RepID=UPI001106F05C|nr:MULTISPECIES: 3-isopropylmalate dehydratase [Hungatella]MCI7383405.1 3-isopropylmalate dehydratase [Hungatella sp.]MDY6235877.1 3-isopropylmalate dehydratase [Hungatella hathewayi]